MISLIQLLFPHCCAACECVVDTRRTLCRSCEDSITPVVTTFLPVGTYTVPVFALATYKDPIRKLILAKNYGDILAARDLGTLIAQRTHVSHIQADYCVPVPLHWKRYATRGYNQAYEMAKSIRKHCHIPILNAIKRTQATAYQASLSARERASNTMGVFVVKNHYKPLLAHKHIILVDDLFTTGATARAAIKALTHYKPATITVAVAARVV